MLQWDTKIVVTIAAGLAIFIFGKNEKNNFHDLFIKKRYVYILFRYHLGILAQVICVGNVLKCSHKFASSVEKFVTYFGHLTFYTTNYNFISVSEIIGELVVLLKQFFILIKQYVSLIT